jgi:hypothetical protein
MLLPHERNDQTRHLDEPVELARCRHRTWRRAPAVKPEQASKVMMRMSTRLNNGEGSMGGEEIDERTRSIRRGSGHGTLEW